MKDRPQVGCHFARPHLRLVLHNPLQHPRLLFRQGSLQSVLRLQEGVLIAFVKNGEKRLVLVVPQLFGLMYCLFVVLSIAAAVRRLFVAAAVPVVVFFVGKY